MKATGIVRRIDDLGRVVIPKELRRVMGIREGDPLEIFADKEKAVLKKFHAGCVTCGRVDRPMNKLYPETLICMNCVKVIVENQEKIISEMQ
ncbi:AbrB/MazE/SpoVT family DNA-binding domain-containing protein [Chengkuizengella sp. SCS-71B]|uniref:AbrB/MazE/SpoVT family DNA-binding domain-containing protein n=1 Tax=Chengkuizengella sp. SCS-71B TaxID=3115290 RepID=UPI0032C23F4C